MQSPHILLISLETIRRDHLRLYGYSKDLAPHLDRLMRGGVYCTDAVANCGWTLPQNTTLLTGLYPLTHNLTLLRDQPPLSRQHILLSEHLKAHGYKTFAGINKQNRYSGHAIQGLDRGYDEHNPGAIYNQHMDWTEEFILSRFRDNHESGPCFMFIHINDTHEPFDAPEPWRAMWGDSYHNLYEGDITYVDHYLGRIFAGLRDIGIFDDMVIVIAGDHGTEMWDHGFTEKKLNLYNEILHIPMIFHCPARLPANHPLPGLAETAQVAPTILDIAGLSALPTAQGKSLAPRIRGAEAAGLDFVCSHTRHEHQRDGGPALFDHYAIQTLAAKFIKLEIHSSTDSFPPHWKHQIEAMAVRAKMASEFLKPGTVIRELFDLKDDPQEGRSLLLEPTEDATALAKDLETKLDAWIAECQK